MTNPINDGTKNELLMAFKQALEKREVLSQQDNSENKTKILATLEARMEKKKMFPGNTCPDHGQNNHTDTQHQDYHTDKHNESHLDRDVPARHALISNSKLKPDLSK